MSTPPIRVLIVEDNPALAENIADFLEGKHYQLDFAPDGLVALHLLASQTYDVIVMDVMLPAVSGYELCQRLRHELRSNTPVIMMTAKDQIDDKARGFHEGADDYLVKPFHLRELELRIAALYRRAQAATRTLQRGNLRYEPGTLTLHVGRHAPIELSSMAAQLVEVLLRACPDLVSHDTLGRTLWGERVVEPHTLRTHIYMLRKLLQNATGHPVIHTVRGRGYRLIPPQGD